MQRVYRSHRNLKRTIKYIDCRKFKLFLLLISVTGLMVYAVLKLPAPPNSKNVIEISSNEIRFHSWNHWNNVSGFPSLIVPNLVHFIKFRQHTLLFTEMVVILAAWCHQKPNRLIIHCDCDNLSGRYWKQVKNLQGVEVRRIREPMEVFGQPISPFYSVYHAADVARIEVLQEYGGIALDLDSYIVRNLDEFRHYECTVGWPVGANIGCQVIIAHKDSRFLHLYKESYRYYNASSWYYNAGQLPTRILRVLPHLVHRVPVKLGVDMTMLYHLYEDPNWSTWRSFYSVHLFLQHRSPRDIAEFNEDNIRNYSFPFGEMARLVVFGNTDRMTSDNVTHWDVQQCRKGTIN